MRIKQVFTLKDAKKIVEFIRGDYARGAFASYFGLRNTHDVNHIKQHRKQIESIIQNWGLIPKNERNNRLNEAIWDGQGYKEEKVTLLTASPSLMVSGFDEKGKPFAYEIEDEKTIQKLLKVTQMKNSEIGPLMIIGDTQVRKPNCVAKAIKIAKENGRKLEVTVNG